MFITLLMKEIHETVQTNRFLIAALLCLVLLPLGMYVTAKNYEQRLDEFRDNENLYHQRVEGRLHYSFQGEGYRPPSPLSVFSIGLEYFMPNKVLTNRNGRYAVINDKGIDNPQSLLFGKIDFLFNVVYILSMLSLIFTFSSIAGEKESATLRLVLSNPVPRWMIVVAKVLGNYVVFLAPFAFALGVGFLLLALSDSIAVFSLGTLSTVAVMLAVTLIFLFSMFCLGLMVSSQTYRSLSAMVLLMFIWVVFVLVIPKISPMLAEIFYPVKSASVVTQEKQLARNNLEKELDAESRELFDEITHRFGIDTSSLGWPPANETVKTAYAQYDEEAAVLRGEHEQRVAAAFVSFLRYDVR